MAKRYIIQNVDVGIGTTTPNHKLDINGGVRTTGRLQLTPGVQDISPSKGGRWIGLFKDTYNSNIGNNYPDPEAGILFTNRATTGFLPWGMYMGVVKDVASTSNTSIRLDIGSSHNLDTPQNTGNDNTLIPNLTGRYNGNVGIGTNAPTRILDVHGITEVGGDTAFDGLRVKRRGTGTSVAIGFENNTTFFGRLAYQNGVGFRFFNSTTTTTHAMVVGQTGNIGIGDMLTPNHELDVDGDVRIRESNTLKFGGTGAADSKYEIVYNSVGETLDFNFIG